MDEHCRVDFLFDRILYFITGYYIGTLIFLDDIPRYKRAVRTAHSMTFFTRSLDLTM